MDLLTRAVANNVAWCALVGRGGTADDAHGVWAAHGAPPPLFPDVVTLRLGVDAADVVAALEDRPTCSVKDSFADVDLAPYGFRELVAAHWLALGAPTPPAGGVPGRWARVAGNGDLATWCTAAGLPTALPDRLLSDPTVTVLAASDSAGRLVAGAITNRSDGVAGVSNVFHVDGGTWVWAQLAAVVAEYAPALTVVGYERGAYLDAALHAGATDLGPLRVWLRD